MFVGSSIVNKIKAIATLKKRAWNLKQIAILSVKGRWLLCNPDKLLHFVLLL